MKNFDNNPFKYGTHKQVVYDYLLDGKTITTRTAMLDLGIGDLQGVIRDLKETGINIESKYTSAPTRYGKNATFKEYKLSV